ncbi:hypothetical protein HDE_09316 [Halotydeus destructor]|nr:hypothetical protein HDE_09316 [Halotydeus destructor]
MASSVVEKFLTSPLVQSFSRILNPITISTGKDKFGDIVLDPLYVLPIAAVVALCLLVYTFGFKSTPSIPPTLHLLVGDGRTKKGKKKDNPVKKVQPKANGHVAPVKSSQPQPKVEPKTTKVPKDKQPKKADKKVQPAKVIKKPVEEPQEDVDSGDWVTVERKPKKDKKKKDDPTPAVVSPVVPKKDKKGKATKKEAPVSSLPVATENFDTEPIVIDNEVVPAPIEVPIVASNELPAEDPEQYAENPSKQLSKKAIKSAEQLKQRRISESDRQVAPIVVEQSIVPEELAVSAKPADKITAEIIASYDGDTVQSDPKSKSKKKKKKPAPITEPLPVAVEAKAAESSKPQTQQPAKTSAKKEKVSESVTIPEEKSVDVSEVTDSSEGDFKVVKKRKARRE